MPFVRDTFADGIAGNTPITAAKLNNIETELVLLDTAVFRPEGYGTVVYGAGVTQAQATANAAAVQAAIDAANNGGGIAANTTGGGIVDIRGVIECYTPAAVSALTLYSGVHLFGHGIGGDIFSGTDVNLPYRTSVLRLWSGANQDLIRTANFATLTGQTVPSAYATPSRFGLHHLVLDGNKAGNTTGLPLRIFGRSYLIDWVTIQNGAQGGAYSEYGSGGYEMEAKWSDFTITDNRGDGLEWRGPHDSLFVNGVIARNDTDAPSTAFNGVNMVKTAYVGGEQFVNVHVWGTHKQSFVLGTTNASFANCIADGAGIQLIGSGNQWVGGSILGTNSITVVETAITLGDGTSLTTQGNRVMTRVYNYAKGSQLYRYRSGVSTARNFFDIQLATNGNIRFTFADGASTLSSGATLPATPLALVSTAGFAASGSAYISDGTNVTVVNYTGVSGNTLTGVTGGSGTFAAGSLISATASGATASDYHRVLSDDGLQGLWQEQQGSVTQTFLSPTSYNVGVQTIRPNSSATAIQWLRNETSRLDFQWDNTGSAGSFFWMNGAILNGRKDTTTATWRLNGATGAVQPGTTAGVGGSLFSGSGVPGIAGAVGDYYFRTDTPGTVTQRIYVCTVGGGAGAATWVATAA